jgi:hypothetical protein
MLESDTSEVEWSACWGAADKTADRRNDANDPERTPTGSAPRGPSLIRPNLSSIGAMRSIGFKVFPQSID